MRTGNEPLISSLTDDEMRDWGSFEIYKHAQIIEEMLMKNGAIPNKDYTILDLFKLAADTLKGESLNYIGTALDSLASSVDDIYLEMKYRTND